MTSATPTESSALLTIGVVGIPVPQGSKRIGRQGARFVILDDNDRVLRPWRQLVRMRALAEIRGLDGYPIDGPVMLVATFALPRPKRMPRNRTEPCVKPDLSKLIRAIEDSLTDAHVWTDDSRVTCIAASKRYTEDGEEPNVTIGVEAL
jgi:Holliday junction resolvase RusA-like endonuclease